MLLSRHSSKENVRRKMKFTPTCKHCLWGWGNVLCPCWPPVCRGRCGRWGRPDEEFSKQNDGVTEDSTWRAELATIWKGETSLEYGDMDGGGKYPRVLISTLSSLMTFLSCWRISFKVSVGWILWLTTALASPGTTLSWVMCNRASCYPL